MSATKAPALRVDIVNPIADSPLSDPAKVGVKFSATQTDVAFNQTCPDWCATAGAHSVRVLDKQPTHASLTRSTSSSRSRVATSARGVLTFVHTLPSSWRAAGSCRRESL